MEEKFGSADHSAAIASGQNHSHRTALRAYTTISSGSKLLSTRDILKRRRVGNSERVAEVFRTLGEPTFPAQTADGASTVKDASSSAVSSSACADYESAESSCDDSVDHGYEEVSGRPLVCEGRKLGCIRNRNHKGPCYDGTLPSDCESTISESNEPPIKRSRTTTNVGGLSSAPQLATTRPGLMCSSSSAVGNVPAVENYNQGYPLLPYSHADSDECTEIVGRNCANSALLLSAATTPVPAIQCPLCPKSCNGARALRAHIASVSCLTIERSHCIVCVKCADIIPGHDQLRNHHVSTECRIGRAAAATMGEVAFNNKLDLSNAEAESIRAAIKMERRERAILEMDKMGL